jgi:hypothetical protein
MLFFLKQFKQILLTAACMLVIAPVLAQVKQAAPAAPAHHASSKQLKDFFLMAAQANVTFKYPAGFREIAAPDDEDFSYDYALELPGKDFEIWFQIKSEKEDWFNYTRTQDSRNEKMENPDSVYNDMGKAQASTFCGDENYFSKSMPPDVLARYNADAGKSYLLTLLDLPETKHYKYALLITLQKNRTGRILAVCFTNQKNPEFYQEVKRASNCLKFKP